MDRLEFANAKELRGDIIRNLYILLGQETQIRTLKSLLRYKGYNTEKNIVRAVEYLAGAKKEYIEILLNEDDYWSSVIKITPVGVNLAEQDIQDLGVMLNE